MITTQKSTLTHKIAISGLLIALSVIVNAFRFEIPVIGRVSFGSVFLNFAAMLFGPLFGGIVNGMSDIVAFIVKPNGPFLWQITLANVLKGVLIGYLFQIFGFGLELKQTVKVFLMQYLKLIPTIGIPSLLFTTVNTFILIKFVPAYAERNYLVFLIPRLFRESAMVLINIYILVVLLDVYYRTIKPRQFGGI